MKKRFGAGSISIALFILAMVWSTSIKAFDNFCLGDFVLNAIGLQAWSNGSHGTHYAIFYSIVFLLPAIIMGYKFRSHLFAKTGTICSTSLTGVLVLALFFMI